MSDEKKPKKGGTLRGMADKGGTLHGMSGKGGTLHGMPGKGGTLHGMPGEKTGKAADKIKPFEDDTPKAQVAEVKVLKKEAQTTDMGQITLNDVVYNIDALVSDSTGEAVVYKLSKGGNTYALKLYFAGIEPDANVVAALKQCSGTGFLVDLIDYGQWTSPQGEVRSFELMPFYTGGELKPGQFKGNPEALKATAAAMMMAVKTAHDHNILHKDIKPENFMYSDESRTQLMLTDFGIASTFQRDSKGNMLPLKMYAQWRTKVYAAPEIYTVIDNELEYADNRSDYYSLGMALLTLWSGDDELLNLGERKLLSLKRNESGSLPFPTDMPDQLLTLIKGLTVPVSEHRWGYDEFIRWVKGEKVPVYGSATGQPESGLNILYNGSKGQRATSLEELAALMMEDTKLAANYLYSGQIAKWMREGGYPEMEAEIIDYVTKQYPTNKEAGVLATIYLLDVDMPYVGPTGNKLHNEKEIAADMVSYATKYLPMMADKDSSLYVYFRSGGIGHLADEFQPMARKGQMDAFKAMWRMIFTLDPGAQFPVYDPRTPNQYYTYDSIEDIVDFFSKLPENSYDKTNSAIPYLLYDEAFIMWLKYRNEPLAGKIKSKLEQENPNSKQLYYYIWYLLAPERNYDLQADQSKMLTMAQVAEKLNDYFVSYYTVGRHTGDYQQAWLDNINQLVSLNDNRLYYYLKSKELYKEKFDYIAYCYDLNSKDNKQKSGPYNLEIATFKALKALNDGNVFYYFPKSEKIVWTVDDLNNVPEEEQKDEMQNGLLKWWLAVQYQEDPYADLSEDLTYESLLAGYLDKISDIDEDDPVFERYVEGAEMVNSGSARCKKIIRSVYLWRGVFFLLVALPLLAVAVLAGFGGLAHVAHPSRLIDWGIIALNLTILLRIIQIFPKTDEWLLQPFGENLGNTLLLHRWVVSLIYGIAIAAICWLCEAHGNIGRFVIPALCLGVLAWRYKLTISDFPLLKKNFDDAINPDFTATVVEPLYYAWHDEGKDFDSETLDRQTTYCEGTRDERNSCIKRVLFSLVPVALLIGLYICYSPALEKYIKANDPQRWEKVYGEGRVVTEDAVTTAYYADVRSSLTVRKSASAKAAAMGTLSKGEQMEVIEIEGEWAKIKYGEGEGYVNKNYIKPVGGEAPATDKPAQTKPKASSKVSQPAAAGPQQAVAEPVKEVAPRKPKLYTVRPDYNQIDVYSAKTLQSHFNIGSLEAGETFEILSNDGQFAKFIYKGRDAYVRSMMIVPVED